MRLKSAHAHLMSGLGARWYELCEASIWSCEKQGPPPPPPLHPAPWRAPANSASASSAAAGLPVQRLVEWWNAGEWLARLQPCSLGGGGGGRYPDTQAGRALIGSTAHHPFAPACRQVCAGANSCAPRVGRTEGRQAALQVRNGAFTKQAPCESARRNPNQPRHAQRQQRAGAAAAAAAAGAGSIPSHGA